MAWEWFETYRHLLPYLVFLLSVSLTLALSSRGRHIGLPVAIGALTPVLLIFAGLLYWDGQQPDGGFLTMIGWIHASQSLIFGALGAVSAALFRILRRELLSGE